jgi:hypothetical protein
MRKILLTVGIIAATVGLVTHLYRFITEWQHLQRATDLGILTSSSFALLELIFILSLIGCAFGLLVKRRSIRVSLLAIGLLGTCVASVYWYWFSSRKLAGIFKDSTFVQHPEFIPRNNFGLIGAYWWDAPILILNAIILIVFIFLSLRHLPSGASRTSTT